jgi:hypothetical protein
MFFIKPHNLSVASATATAATATTSNRSIVCDLDCMLNKHSWATNSARTDSTRRWISAITATAAHAQDNAVID